MMPKFTRPFDLLMALINCDRLTEWSEKWQLPFNVNKCKILHIGKKIPLHEYAMSGKTLEVVKGEKDLGVIVDDELKFRKQAAAAVKKANTVLGLIAPIANYYQFFTNL